MASSNSRFRSSYVLTFLVLRHEIMRQDKKIHIHYSIIKSPGIWYECAKESCSPSLTGSVAPEDPTIRRYAVLSYTTAALISTFWMRKDTRSQYILFRCDAKACFRNVIRCGGNVSSFFRLIILFEKSINLCTC
jgi:hypothetical protein